MEYKPYTSLDFTSINQQATTFASLIRSKHSELVALLLTYESFEVANDEIERTLDILENLTENSEYFKLRAGEVTSFLPKNQPLYALTCFVIIPSLMSSAVYFRVPQSMCDFLPKVLALLNVAAEFPNIVISTKERLAFLKERSALMCDEQTGNEKPLTDVVIFTGTSKHADQLRLVFDTRTLFITNGAGHNPIVVSYDAHIPSAVEATLTLSLYNQGQDCAAPNAILVHKDVHDAFMQYFYSEFAKIKTGPYSDTTCSVGPISNPEDLKNIQEILVENRQWLDSHTKGIIRTAEAIVEPTIFNKPLSTGGNYTEAFAPLLFIQKYDDDRELALYFENDEYIKNAMYVTLYGTSAYISELIGREIQGKILHKEDTFVHNTHLHAHGIERGVKPYGGYSYGGSSLSIHGKIIPKPTLPQRDMYEHIIEPLLKDDAYISFAEDVKKMTSVKERKVEKIMKLHTSQEKVTDHQAIEAAMYVDTKMVLADDVRYKKIQPDKVFTPLLEANVAHLATLREEEIDLLLALKALLHNKANMTNDEFAQMLYSIPKKAHNTDEENSTCQLAFFKNIYRLLFGKEFGPRLNLFLYEIDNHEVEKLIDI